MRIGLVSDLHSNLTALEAVVKDLGEVDEVLCLGDVAVASGPQPRQTLARLRELGWTTVMGDHDLWLLDPSQHDRPAPEWLQEAHAWTRSALTQDDLDFIASFRDRIERDLGPFRLLCFHASPRARDDILTAETPTEQIDPMLAGERAEVIAVGHSHSPMVRRHRGCLLVNPGSVGLPYIEPGYEAPRPPWAEYAIVAATGDRLSVELRRVAINRSEVAEAILRSGMPNALRVALAGWRLIQPGLVGSFPQGRLRPKEPKAAMPTVDSRGGI